MQKYLEYNTWPSGSFVQPLARPSARASKGFLHTRLRLGLGLGQTLRLMLG